MKVKTKNIFIYIISFIGIISNIYVLSVVNNSLSPILYLVMYGLLAVYLVYDYKTPHGNLLKYLLLIYSFSLILPSTIGTSESIKVRFCLCFAAIIVSYIGGRLNRKEDNMKLITTVAICLIIALAFGFTDKITSIEFDGETINYVIALDLLNYLILWAGIITTYLTRFNEHKEAGIKAEK